MSSDPQRAFAVLVVCTGNLCRSPAAELLLRAGLDAGAGITVASAGLEARVGEPIAESMARLLRAHGLDPESHRARQLEPETVRTADVVLTMTTRQRAAVVGLVPAAVRRTFTLREFAALAALVDGVGEPAVPTAQGLAHVLREVPAARARRIRPDADDDDIPDPFGRDDEVFARVFHKIDAAVGNLLAPPGRGDVTLRGVDGVRDLPIPANDPVG